jgi:hypothetical protein
VPAIKREWYFFIAAFRWAYDNLVPLILNTFDYNFVMNVHGANAFLVDLGSGSEKTYLNMIPVFLQQIS